MSVVDRESAIAVATTGASRTDPVPVDPGIGLDDRGSQADGPDQEWLGFPRTEGNVVTSIAGSIGTRDLYRSKQLNPRDEYIPKPDRAAFEAVYSKLQLDVKGAAANWSSTFMQESGVAFATATPTTWDTCAKEVRDTYSNSYISRRASSEGRSEDDLKAILLFNWYDQHGYAARRQGDSILCVPIANLPRTRERESDYWLQRYLAASQAIAFFAARSLIDPNDASDLLSHNFETQMAKRR